MNRTQTLPSGVTVLSKVTATPGDELIPDPSLAALPLVPNTPAYRPLDMPDLWLLGRSTPVPFRRDTLPSAWLTLCCGQACPDPPGWPAAPRLGTHSSFFPPTLQLSFS